MKRTTISLPDDLAARLEREAERRRTSVSEVIRWLAVRHFGLDRPRDVPFASLGRSGRTDVSSRADEFLSAEWRDAIAHDRDS
jgi:hypothetical protein